jgi:asparagine synthase (glutamine-hydrolysing)
MCGLTGVVSSERIPEADALIRAMNNSLHHRGPDQDGVFLDPAGKSALAHKRLSIIDVTHGRQPMTDVDGIFTLVFNGEIYNHAGLKAELIAKGHPIRTRSDTEVLLYAYKEWGSGCLERLRGMFAFAVLDARDGSVFLARDRLGIKPLYYGYHDGIFGFASECKAILEIPGFPRAMDLEALSDYFSLMYVPAPKSIYKAIRKLPAGHWLRKRPGSPPEIGQYWDLRFEGGESEGRSVTDYARAAEDLLACLDEAVTSHMESDVPLGAFLSGGVDSAAVAALMARHSSRPILTNTIGFSDKTFDETEPAARTAAFLKTDHRAFEVRPDAVEVMGQLAWYYDEPFADSSMIPTYYVCGMARQRVTVALSGDGGDENFAGYRRYYFDALENRVRAALPAALRRPLFGALGALYPKADWLPQRLRAKTLLTNLSFDPMRGYFTSLSHFHPAMKRALFTADLRKSLAGYDSLSVFEAHWNACRSRDPLSRVQYLDFKTYLADDILVKVDRASMAHALEVRVPVLDHLVVEKAASLPSAWKLQGRNGKRIFKDAVRPLLPAEVFSRPKTGFSIPLAAWLRKELRDYAHSLLLGAKGLPATGLFERSYLERLWKEHQSGIRDHAYPLFALLSFAQWHALYQGAALPPAPARKAFVTAP